MTSAHVGGEILAEAAPLPAGSEHFWVALRLQTGAAPERRVRVVLALDRSWSMRGPRLEAAKRAARTLVALMRDDDELGVVLFDGAVDVVQPVARVDGRLRATLGALLAGVRAGQGTALADATITALAQARPVPGGAIRGEGHAIVLTDGFPYVGETDPKRITALVASHAIDATLTTIAFGDELDGPLLASMAQAGLGRFLHLGEQDDAPAALAAELATTAGEITTRARVTVQLKDALAVAYRGMADARPRPTIELTLPPLVEGDGVVWPIAVQPLERLEAGTHEIGLATVRTARLDGAPLVLELPMRVEVGAQRGAPSADVMRARCLFHAARVMRMVATDDVPAARLVSLLRDMAAHVLGQAVAVGLASDGPITAAIAMLRHAARMLDEHGDVSRVAASATAAGLESQYDPSVGSARSPMFELRTLAQQHGVSRATFIAPLVESPAVRPARAPRPSIPPPAAVPKIDAVLPEWRVRIVYVEPTYAKHHGQPEQEYSGSFTVRASNEGVAEALARDEFQRAAKSASVGWVRAIVRVEVSRVQ
jgi:Mg-chelatase subunit ChlD